MWDLFISHAAEDKDEIARPLAQALIVQGVKVWFDETELKLGDSLRRSIDHGLSQSRFGLVILSPDFFRKEWPQKELDGLVAREDQGKVILPVWHKVGRKEIHAYSTLLSDRLGVSTALGLQTVVAQIMAALNFNKSKSLSFPAEFIDFHYFQDLRPPGKKYGNDDFTTPFGGGVLLNFCMRGADDAYSSDETIVGEIRLDLKRVLSTVRAMLVVFNKAEKENIFFYRKEDHNWERTTNCVGLAVEFDVSPGIKHHPKIDSFFIDIEADYVAIACWDLKNDEELFALLTPDEIKLLETHLVELLQVLYGEKIVASPLVPLSCLPKMLGGHGFFMYWRLSSASAKLDD